MMKITAAIKKTGHSLITWEWTKALLHWLIISAGTMSEFVFLIASLWVSINANVHQFVLLFLDEPTTRHITELATTAYVALPECIVGLAVVTTLSHVRMVMYRRDYRSVIWAVLFGLPTIIFLVLSLITLGCSVASVTFEMPTPLVVIRALAGYGFAFTSLLYTQIGKRQERDRLEEKDALLEDLHLHHEKSLADFGREKDRLIKDLNDFIHQQTEKYDAKTSVLQAEVDDLKSRLSASQRREAEMVNRTNQSPEMALQAYPQECIEWLQSGASTVSLETIVQKTGHSKRKITAAIASGKLKTTSRNANSIFVASLIDWLKDNAPSMSKEADSGPMLRVVNEQF